EPGRRYAFSAEERDAELRSLETAKGSPLVVADEDDLLEKKETADVVLYTIYEADPVTRIVQEIESLHFSPRVFRAERSRGAQAPKLEPIGRLVFSQDR